MTIRTLATSISRMALATVAAGLIFAAGAARTAMKSPASSGAS